MSDIRNALVVGGGIAGPVAAMALRKAGIDAAVYEAYEGTADGVGGGLGIAPNGLNALAVVEADDIVRDLGDPVASMVIESWTGKRLAEFGSPAGPPVFHAVWRTDLYRAMYDRAVSRGIRIEHGKRLIDVRDHGDSVTAVFADGTQATADILIAADGIRSTVRPLLDPAAPAPRYTGLLGFGARPSKAYDAGLDSTRGSMHMSFGKRAFFAYQVAEDGSTGWFANLPARQALSNAATRQVGAAEWLRRLREAFADDRTPASAILARVAPEDLVMVGALEDLPPVPTWSKGRIVLVGDAAHATSPSSGQGASIATESAVQLARCLRDLPTVPEAFAAYEGLRRSRVERIIADGKRTSSEKAAGPVARMLRDAVMPVTMKVLAKPEKMEWQVGYRIDWAAPVVPAAGHAVSR
ncbi:MAG TPA: NAD(P)/FAD-dependent oxidoreductase [Pseudonocardiaceae bacterium]|jgi:2-polyprenyl-6-methoxyphenol hydroxylase-like FAD-dependent oxidoreductase|nr:NAD(P)/FAD-dependent oxidoreductase [Pseudonocardiaceae bacterium]